MKKATYSKHEPHSYQLNGERLLPSSRHALSNTFAVINKIEPKGTPPITRRIAALNTVQSESRLKFHD
jgi:hypothetical protein